MPFAARIEKDSVAPCGRRLTTFVVSFPKFIQAEVNTHRMLSRGSASSRAIPVEKLLKRVEEDPVIPVTWGRNRRGMQSTEVLDYAGQEEALQLWLEGRRNAIDIAQRMAALGVHKQITNRLVEPWMFTEVIVSATEWENFFRLRCHADAQPEFQKVAFMMKDLYETSTPTSIQAGEWHLPLWRDEEWPSVNYDTDRALRIATARCARISYLTHDGRRDVEEDLRLHDQLKESGHWGPYEHCAMALEKPYRIGNYFGWRQYRADADPHFLATEVPR